MKCTKVITNTNDVIFHFIKTNLQNSYKNRYSIGPIISVSYDILYYKIITPKIIPSKAWSTGTVFLKAKTLIIMQ
jgi:hypothetical protein